MGIGQGNIKGRELEHWVREHVTERGFYSRSFSIPWKIYSSLSITLNFTRPTRAFCLRFTDLWIENRVCYEVSHVRIIKPLSRLAGRLSSFASLRSLEPLYRPTVFSNSIRRKRGCENEGKVTNWKKRREIEQLHSPTLFPTSHNISFELVMKN